MNRKQRRAKAATTGGKLPWDTLDYSPLEPGDLDPSPAPSPGQRTRVAAALLTLLRDGLMIGGRYGGDGVPNAEVIRAVLVMSPVAWARDIGEVRAALGARGFDPVDPKTRWQQTKDAWERGRS